MKCLKSGTYWTAYYDNRNERYVARLVFTSYEGQELYDYEITKEIYDKLGSFEDDYDNVGLIKTARMTHSMEDTRHTPHTINSVYDDNWEAVFKAAYQCAMDEVDELAETGDVESCVWVTAHNSVYTATEEEKQKVFRCWSKAAENGNPMAQWTLGMYYKEGKYTEKNYDKAMEWFRKSADQGYEKAIMEIAWDIILQWDEKTRPKAYDMMDKAVAANPACAYTMLEVAWSMIHQPSVQIRREAIELMKKAAAAGDYSAKTVVEHDIPIYEAEIEAMIKKSK